MSTSPVKSAWPLQSTVCSPTRSRQLSPCKRVHGRVLFARETCRATSKHPHANYGPATAKDCHEKRSCQSDAAEHHQQLLKRGAATALAAASIGLALAAPLPALAEVEMAPTELQQSQDVLATPLSRIAPLPLAEPPALVANSSEVIMEGVKEAVAGGLQDLTANSMAAVGGPVTGEVLSGIYNNSGSSSSSSSEPSSNTTAAATISSSTQGSATAAVPTEAVDSSAATSSAAASPAQLGVLCCLWNAYCHALETSPLMTKVYTGVVGTLLGDLVAQLLSYQQTKHSSSGSGNNKHASSKPGTFKFDVLRCGRLCLYSAAIGTPMGHYWYEVLEALVMPSSPTAPAAVAAKVCLDQLVQTPFGMALFFAVMKVMEGQPRKVKQELQSKVMPGLLANWKLWPAAQLINFTVIPPEQRILFGNIVGVCWTCIISNMQQSSSSSSAVEPESAIAAKTAGSARAAGGVDRPSTALPA